MTENATYPLYTLTGKCENYVSFAVVNTQVLHCAMVSKKKQLNGVSRERVGLYKNYAYFLNHIIFSHYIYRVSR